MDQKQLIVNIGSQSKKYALALAGKVVAREHLEPGVDLSAEQFKSGFKLVLDRWLAAGKLSQREEIGSIGIRIVAPGTFFQTHRQLDVDYRSRLQQMATDWPLHLLPVIDELSLIDELLPNVPTFGISDSAFHATLPERTRRLPLRYDLAESLDLYRFGYHGLSLSSIVRSLRLIRGGCPEKLIVAHLGGGVSITAIHNGNSVDTSLGFSPLGGVPMSTRSGDLDPGAIVHLLRQTHWTPERLLSELESHAGLLALSQDTGEVRDLLLKEIEHDPLATLALEVLLNNVLKFIGGYFVLLGGADLVVLTGTIAERATSVVSRLQQGLALLLPSSKVVVIPNDEMDEMAKIMQTLR